MPLAFIGIDPGITGAVAIIHEFGAIEVHDTPVVEVLKGKKMRHEYSGMQMAKILGPFAARDGVIAVLENVWALPEEGAVGAFSFGRGVGLWEGILSAFRIRYEKVTPQRWKKEMMDGMGKAKDASRLQAQRLFPKAELDLKKHHGRADALLMAEFCKRFCSLK